MSDQNFSNLSGKMLIASPYALVGDVFYKSLIYMLSHTADGAAGLIINHLMNRVPMKSLFHIAQDNLLLMDMALSIYLGGPVEIEKGFFLHSGEYNKNLLFQFKEGISISSNTGILQDIAAGSGPKKSLFIVGYTGWAAGQLESELENNLWLVADSDPDLIFSEKNDAKWQTALQKIGIENSHFAPQLGHC